MKKAIARVKRLTGAPEEAIRDWIRCVGVKAIHKATDAEIRRVVGAF